MALAVQAVREAQGLSWPGWEHAAEERASLGTAAEGITGWPGMAPWSCAGLASILTES